MAPSEAAPTPVVSFPDLISHAKQTRMEVRTVLAITFTKMTIVKTESGCKMYALGTPQCSSMQTLLSASLPKSPNGNNSDVVRLTPMYDDSQIKIRAAPSAEFSLMCERQRSAVVSGVMDYSIGLDESNLMLNTGERLYRVLDGRIKSLGAIRVVDLEVDQEVEELTSVFSSKRPGFVSDARVCPSDNRIIAFVLNKKIYIDINGVVVFSTAEAEGVTNGVSPYIAQEELERFEAIWWSPTSPRLLFERVDERAVDNLSFSCPGKLDADPPMRYPRVGLSNATSELRMLIIEDGKVLQARLKYSLRAYFHTMEYIVRAGFANDGRTVWAQLMNRQQNSCVLVLIPEKDFIIDGCQSTDQRNGSCSPSPSTPFVKHWVNVHANESDAWINVHNATVPLDSSDRPGEYSFVYSKETGKGSQLLIVNITLNNDGTVFSQQEFSLLPEDANFSICKTTNVHVDKNRKLVYFLANHSNPIEWNVCVASYSHRDRILFRQLTPDGITFKTERASHSLALHPEVGFACWATSLNQQQHCRFYALHHSKDDVLPTAEYVTEVILAGTAPVPSPTKKEMVPEVIEYKTASSPFTFYALVMKPFNYVPHRSYPVVQYVYGGPGVQVVRNDFSTWVPFQKYTRLGFAVVMLDGRGSANRGLDFESPIKRRLGVVEVEDQLEGLRIVAERCGGLLDLERVVVTGWSYGGYMALMMLAKHPNVYRAAIAGGAVTDWRLYDTAYTERYMGYPLKENYDNCSVLPFVHALPEEPGRLMLIHGLIDENVHFTHMERLINTLIKRGKPYDLKLFPSERHGVRSSESAAYLDACMLRFIIDACNLPSR
ncbi:unnamed protein product [Caenorhabditis auriculariae]|uniref:Uncharacterized protein n=1 Tax=Caenorhabditis auriculariae TaxID=2777116 RepID=A0A8S1GSB5_9PELO|nr:unnamed protein product [Caenorhabditis auriculariae]